MTIEFNRQNLELALKNGIFEGGVKLFLAFCWFALILSVLGQGPWFRDATDEPGWFGKRSGMTLKTDLHTRCQYLVTGGGITPRIDAQGRHMGCWETSQ